MPFKIVLQIVDGQDVVLNTSKPLEKRLERRFSKDQMDMALLAAEDQLVEAIKDEKKHKS